MKEKKNRLIFKSSLYSCIMSSLCISQIITYWVILQRTFSKMSKSTNKARKHRITLFLFSRTQLSSWGYKTGAKPCVRFQLSRTQMSALAVRLGSCGHSNKSKHAKISFAWLDRPLWTIAPTTCDFSLDIFAWSFEILLSRGRGFYCCPSHPEW